MCVLSVDAEQRRIHVDIIVREDFDAQLWVADVACNLYHLGVSYSTRTHIIAVAIYVYNKTSLGEIL